MPESENLRTASLYINNQLLSRGLLRNGQNIDFSRPERGDGGMEGTMGRIMGVVNDLILRRDRDATQREALTTTLRTLRADQLLHTTELERIQTKLSESQRKLGIAEASERALKLQLKSAENSQRGLKEEMAKMKILVQQSRNACAVEVRKRERTIEGLKRHVGEGGRTRGNRKEVGVREITVVAGVGEEGKGHGMSVQEEGYDLRSETNEFLTELARGLSEENENLAALLRGSVESLRNLSGCEAKEDTMVVTTENGYQSLATEMEGVVEHVRHILTNPSFVPLEEVEERDEEIARLRNGWEKMEARWREAVQMMEGWRRRMARSGQTVNLEELKMGLLLSPLRSKEAENPVQFQLSTLMEEGEDEGDTQADIDAMDDSGINNGEVEVMEPEFDDELDEDSESSLFEDEPEEEIVEVEDPTKEEEEEEEETEEGFTLNTESSVSPGPAPQLSPLRSISGNRNASPEYRYEEEPQEREGFSTIMEENTYELLQLRASSPKKQAPRSQRSTPRSSHAGTLASSGRLHTPVPDEVSLIKTSPRASPQPQAAKSTTSSTASTSTRLSNSARKPAPSPRKTVQKTPKPAATPRLQLGSSTKLPRPRDGLPQQSPLTMASIAAKLAASEREADAARVRAKIKAARAKRIAEKSASLGVPGHPNPSPRKEEAHAATEGAAEVESPGKDENRRKRKAAPTLAGKEGRSKASRRRSTLSPWELESLITGTVDSPRKTSK